MFFFVIVYIHIMWVFFGSLFVYFAEFIRSICCWCCFISMRVSVCGARHADGLIIVKSNRYRFVQKIVNIISTAHAHTHTHTHTQQTQSILLYTQEKKMFFCFILKESLIVCCVCVVYCGSHLRWIFQFLSYVNYSYLPRIFYIYEGIKRVSCGKQ